MPNTRSAAKRMRSDQWKHAHNQSILSELDTRWKKLVVLSQKKEEANEGTLKEQGRILVSKLDKAVVHGVIPHGRADRKKARIAKLINRK